MATVITTKNGKRITLLNPSEKSERYAEQLRTGVVQETEQRLTKNQKAFRAGYLTARSDNTKVYKHKKKVRAEKRNSKVDFVQKLENAAMKRFKKPYIDLSPEQRVKILDSTGTTKELLNQK